MNAETRQAGRPVQPGAAREPAAFTVQVANVRVGGLVGLEPTAVPLIAADDPIPSR